MSRFQRQSRIAVPASVLRDWHLRPGAFSRLNPPWESAEVVESPGALTDGARAVIRVGIGPLKQKWVAEHQLTDTGFIDRQAEGPFASWKHEHRFEPDPEDESASRLTDSIRYRLPLEPFGRWFGGPLVRQKLDRMFRYRHEVTQLDLERQAEEPRTTDEPQNILVTGATGCVGSALEGYLQTRGHTVFRVTRHPSRPGDIGWDLDRMTLDLPSDLRIDAAIHLAGENVASGRWTEAKRDALLESRRRGTRLLAETLAGLPHPPEVLVSASGAGAYPLEGGPHDESSDYGDHFLARICREWEDAAEPARAAGIRVVHPRIGVVLTPAGGALRKLLPPFLAGLGGPVGPGDQRLSWIAMDDVIDALHRAVVDPIWTGPVNLVSVTPASQDDFARTLARVLRRPCLLPVPSSALRLAFGEMADETLLGDNAVTSARLGEWGYRLRYPDLTGALRHLLGRTSPDS